MAGSILYCGDTDLNGAAAYLAGVLAQAGEEFRYFSSSRALTGADLDDELRLVILSDYPASRVTEDLQARIAGMVERGTGLLMIGGWESFHGLEGYWNDAPLAAILPVEMSSSDDRLNSDQPLLVRSTASHAITAGLPWETRPPYVGGLNRFTARSSAETVLEVDRMTARPSGEGWSVSVSATHPLLVVGAHGRGRTAALATDVAPHWVGGFVDWGDGRVAAQAEGAEAVEVGDLYARFLKQLVAWMKG